MKIFPVVRVGIIISGLLAAVVASGQVCRDYPEFMHWTGPVSGQVEHPIALGVAAGHLCVGVENVGLNTYDITNPGRFELIGAAAIPSCMQGVECRGNWAYVLSCYNPLQVFGIPPVL